MGEILANYDVLGAVWMTIKLALLSAIGCTIVGTFVAILRVSPVPMLRGLGTSYVNLLRNTPLTVLMVMSTGSRSSWAADRLRHRRLLVGRRLLTLYPQPCLRGTAVGVNTVPVGRPRLPCDRTHLQPVLKVISLRPSGAVASTNSTYIALIKNTTVAAVIGVADLSACSQRSPRTGSQLPIFFLFALIFVILTLPLMWGTTSPELAVKR
jgi:glutamate transport system permease protein